MTANGFEQSKADYNLFTKGKENDFVALIAYVDDIVIACPNYTKIEEVKRLLSSNFKLWDLGLLTYFLGLEIAYSSQGIFIVSKKIWTLATTGCRLFWMQTMKFTSGSKIEIKSRRREDTIWFPHPKSDYNHKQSQTYN